MLFRSESHRRGVCADAGCSCLVCSLREQVDVGCHNEAWLAVWSGFWSGEEEREVWNLSLEVCVPGHS